MIEFGGVSYYIDLAAFDKAISSSETKENKKITKEIKVYKDAEGKVTGSEEIEYITDREREIDVSKLNVVTTMIEILVDTNEELDTSLGHERALEKTNLSYQIAFNTLYNYKILKEK